MQPGEKSMPRADVELQPVWLSRDDQLRTRMSNVVKPRQPQRMVQQAARFLDTCNCETATDGRTFGLGTNDPSGSTRVVCNEYGSVAEHQRDIFRVYGDGVWHRTLGRMRRSYNDGNATSDVL